MRGFQGTTNWSDSWTSFKTGQKHARLQLGRRGRLSTTSLKVLGGLLGTAVHHLNSLDQLVKDPDRLELPLSQQQFSLFRANSLTHLLLLSQSHLVQSLCLSLGLPAKNVNGISREKSRIKIPKVGPSNISTWQLFFESWRGPLQHSSPPSHALQPLLLSWQGDHHIFQKFCIKTFSIVIIRKSE